MKQLKITRVDNGFLIEVTKQGVSLLKERYDRPTVVIQDGEHSTTGWECLVEFWNKLEEKVK